jgi:hypothetical protein
VSIVLGVVVVVIVAVGGWVWAPSEAVVSEWLCTRGGRGGKGGNEYWVGVHGGGGSGSCWRRRSGRWRTRQSHLQSFDYLQ